MGFWTDLKSSIDEATKGLQGQVAQWKNGPFAEASMAECALVTAADGEIKKEERLKTFKAIQANPLLQVFDMKELKTKYDDYCKELEDDFDFGKMACLAAIAKVKGKDGQDRGVIQLGIIIGGSDGNFDDSEKQAVRESCHAVGVDPASFDL